MILGFVVITFLFSYAAFGQQAKLETLVSVHVLFRHGDRTPTFSYPTDPYINWSWPDGAGALTNKGKSQMYQLGKFLRTFYSNYLRDTYNSKELVVKSSYAARCQMSAAALLAGLYPPKGSQIWNEDLLWQPIPVNPIPREMDNLIVARVPCSAFTEEKKKSDEELANGLTSEQKKLLEYLSEHIGMKISDISTAESLYYTLSIEKDSGLTLPSWTNKIFPEPLKSVAIMTLLSYSRTLPLKRFQSGPLLGEWLSHMESDKEIRSPLMYLYSGHDLTIVNAMRSLGLMTPTPWFPDYGATLLIELHRLIDSNEKPNYVVKILYLESGTSEKPNELKLPNCDLQCPLEEFKRIVEPVIPKDWYEECFKQT
ncbi:venom acid phosphatase Acph-1-like isoform X2 [Rhodnius prolixus]